jgi:starch phosphorylase
MKFAMNGGLIIGTLDGANIEIREESGEDNMFIFGALAHEVSDLRRKPQTAIDERFYNALKLISSGKFGHYSLYESVLRPLFDGNDYYLLGHDFPSYMEAQERVDLAFVDRKAWIKRCIITTASQGKFSSDTTIHSYAKNIWKLEPCKVPRINPETGTFLYD